MDKNTGKKKHALSWYKPGVVIEVHDKMQHNYTYELAEFPGTNFAPDFKPELTPQEMLALGVFEGKYLCDGEYEFPREWYAHARLSCNKPDAQINLFKIKSRLSLQEWRKRGWIPVAPGDYDVRGWFQWYCRYWLGRRIPHIDALQIKRWRAFVRHQAQVIHSIERLPVGKRPQTQADCMTHRPRQRQALLQWAYNPFIGIHK